MIVVVFLINVIVETISLFSLLLLVRVLLSWFPNLPWENRFLATLAATTDPYLNLFRGLIPPIGGLDISSILAFLTLSLVSILLQGLAGPLLVNASYAARYSLG